MSPEYVSQGRSTPWSLGMGDLPPLIGNPYFMGIFQPLRTWVDDHPQTMGVDRPDRSCVVSTRLRDNKPAVFSGAPKMPPFDLPVSAGSFNGVQGTQTRNYLPT